MGIGGIWQWVVVLAIILLLFGTKKLRNLGSDLGQAVKGFRKGMASEDAKDDAPTAKVADAQAADAADTTTADTGPAADKKDG